eukprot:gene2601-5091_t
MSVDIDFTPDALLQREEQDVQFLQEINDLILRGQASIELLKSYTGCAITIREALSDPKNFELQKSSFLAVCRNVEKIALFFNLSSEIVAAVTTLSTRLRGGFEAFEDNPALVKGFGDLLVFCFDFDQQKMLTPEIQNDFSFYRRTFASKALEALPKPVSTDTAHMISMWVAQNLPMISPLATATTNAPEAVASLANVCCGMVQRQSCGEQSDYALKVMVAAIIIYDRNSETGAFVNSSPIKMRRVMRVLSRYGDTNLKLLQDSLKFCTTHYKDSDTPMYIKIALD